MTLAQTEVYGQPKFFLGPPGVVPLDDVQAVATAVAPPPMELRPRHLRIELQGGVPATSLYELYETVLTAFSEPTLPDHELTLLPE